MLKALVKSNCHGEWGKNTAFRTDILKMSAFRTKKTIIKDYKINFMLIAHKNNYLVLLAFKAILSVCAIEEAVQPTGKIEVIIPN